MLVAIIFALVLCCGESYIVGCLPRPLASWRTTRIYAEPSQWPGRDKIVSTKSTAKSKSGAKSPAGSKKVHSVVPVPSVQQAWQSGYTFSKELKPKKAGGWLRNEPWWMLEKESRNPRLLPVYKPWWARKYVRVTGSLTLAELKAQAEERGISTTGAKKAELLARLQEQEAIHALSDDNFIPPVFASSADKDLEACYPDVYEKNNLPLNPV